MGMKKWYADAVRRFAGTVEDDEEAARRKQVGVAGAGILLGFTLLVTLTKLKAGMDIDRLADIMGASSSALSLVYLKMVKAVDGYFLFILSSGFWLCIVFNDLDRLSGPPDVNARKWPYFVILIDLLLVINVPRIWTQIVVALSVGWVVLTGLENTVRFGLYDVPGTVSYSERVVDVCEKPPCRENAGAAFLHVTGSIVIFVADYYFTRGFAEEMAAGKAKMAESIAITQEITTYLAALDLTSAKSCLAATSHRLPDNLHHALDTIVDNLTTYKPYLPQSCIPDHEEERLITQTRNPLDSPSTSTISITYFVVNIRKTHERIIEGAAGYLEGHSGLLQAVLEGVRARRGILEVFLGDKIHCSFNATGRCAMHAAAGLRTALEVYRSAAQPFAINVGVDTGRVLRVKLGCDEVRRVGLFGEVITTAPALERLAAEWGMGIIVGQNTTTDAPHEVELRLIMKKIIFRKSRTPAFLYEVASYAEATTPSNAEWMYELENSASTVWSLYNGAGLMLLRGELLENAMENLVGHPKYERYKEMFLSQPVEVVTVYL